MRAQTIGLIFSFNMFVGFGCGGAVSGTALLFEPALIDDEILEADGEAEKAFDELSKELVRKMEKKSLSLKWWQEELEELADDYPDHAPIRYNLALLNMGADEDISQVWGKLANLYDGDSDFVPGREAHAVALMQAGNFNGAAEILQNVVKKDAQNITGRELLALAYEQLGKRRKTISLCQEILQQQADHIRAFHILARNYVAMGNLPSAELVVGRGLKIEPNSAQLHATAAKILWNRKNVVGAVAKYKEVVRLMPEWLDARARLAEIALSYRDFGTAAQNYGAILKLVPDDTNTKIALAVSYKGQGRYADAERIYMGILAGDADNLDALWNLGVLSHRHLNKFDEAVKAYKRYSKLCPDRDARKKRIRSLVTEALKSRNDRTAELVRVENEQAKQKAIDGACVAISTNKFQAGLAEAIGSEDERIAAAWSLLTVASESMQAGEQAKGDKMIACAFGILPKTSKAQKSACAPMRVMWTRDILYPLGRLEDALKCIEGALVCDKENPDAQLIHDQLRELVKSGSS
jgi:tetratricopeptide (TPR) repeat protein